MTRVDSDAFGKSSREWFRNFLGGDYPRKSHDAFQKGSSPHSPSRATVSTQSDMSVPDTTRPAFDPHLDIATVVFSHVQCVKTRHSLARVSKLWREASKPAAAYPLRFDFDAFPRMNHSTPGIDLLDNDEALSLSYERVVGLLKSTNWGGDVCEDAAIRGCVRLLKWTRENNLVWTSNMCNYAVVYGHLSALKYLHENGCPWDDDTCFYAADLCNWDCLQYAVDNKCPGWEKYAEEYAEHLRCTSDDIKN